MNAINLQEQIRNGAVQVVDVRTGAEWRAGHIYEASHMPLDQIEQGAKPEVGNRPLVLVCQSGVRAAKAQELLRAGNIEAEVLEGGMNAWVEAGLPQVCSSRGVKASLLRQVQIIVGSMNLLGLAMGILVNPWWLVLPAFTSMGLLVAGATGTCGLALLLARMPWNR